jgi:rubrerythrin
MNHLRIAGEVGMTISNLDEAISGETFEFTKMYPKFLETARNERNKRAEWSFNVANQVEEIHAGLFQTALAALKNSLDLSAVEYYVCQVCGHTVDGVAPEKCPICGAPNSKYIKVD